MKSRRVIAAVLMSLLATAGMAPVPSAAASSAAAPVHGGTARIAVAPPPQCQGPFYGKAVHLGPEKLPTTGPVARMLNGYKRFGTKGANQDQFLARYWKNNSWVYPGNGGFKGKPKPYTLKVNTVIDRFGGETGRYFAPEGTSYAKRAIPPQNLNTCEYEKNVIKPNGYYRYKVRMSFPVQAGQIAEWFDQPGGGTQYEVVKVGNQDFPGAGWLVANKYLERLN